MDVCILVLYTANSFQKGEGNDPSLNWKGEGMNTPPPPFFSPPESDLPMEDCLTSD